MSVGELQLIVNDLLSQIEGQLVQSVIYNFDKMCLTLL